MTEHCIDRADGHTRIEGASHEFVTAERLRKVIAEQFAEELLDAVIDSVAGLSHWRSRSQALLRRIENAEWPGGEPKL
jgi:hypothetical protein